MGRNNSYIKPEYREKLRRAKLGKNNPAWKDGQSRKYFKHNTIWLEYYKSKSSCELCGEINKLVTHHRDGNYKNNIVSNLMVVCRSCHNKIHKRLGI